MVYETGTLYYPICLTYCEAKKVLAHSCYESPFSTHTCLHVATKARSIVLSGKQATPAFGGLSDCPKMGLFYLCRSIYNKELVSEYALFQIFSLTVRWEVNSISVNKWMLTSTQCHGRFVGLILPMFFPLPPISCPPPCPRHAYPSSSHFLAL